MGDTGLWYVPTGEVLPRKKWSMSAYRVNFDDNQGFTDVSNWPLTFGVGVGDNAEIFGSWVLVNRVDRDIRPAVLPAESGGRRRGAAEPADERHLERQPARRPLARREVEPLVGVAPAAGGVRAPADDQTADREEGQGASTGKADFALDAVVSKEINQRVEVSGYGGFIVRGKPDAVEETNGFRWGFGAGMPSRKSLRLTAEINGEKYSKSTIATKTILTATDGSFLPVRLRVAAQVPAQRGPRADVAGQERRLRRPRLDVAAEREQAQRFPEPGPPTAPATGWISSAASATTRASASMCRLPRRPPPPPPPPAAPQHTLSVKAACNPCTVEVGKTSTVSAIATDSIGCVVTWQWSAPTGTLTNPRAQNTPWTAPMQTGPVPVTVTVTCPQDGKTASDSVTIQVIASPVIPPIVFDDVYFDFDRYSLRPEAVRTLDEAVAVLQKNADVRVEIEGHTCNIGTAEYNLALGERRATSVRDYLVSRGIGADRFRTVSYGEERPKYDNAREETRRLNRRAALVVRVTR